MQRHGWPAARRPSRGTGTRVCATRSVPSSTSSSWDWWPRPPRGHLHSQAEVYFFLSGTGEVVVEGEATPVRAGDAVFIPGDTEHVAVNTGPETLRLLYFFAADSFEEIIYRFPGRDTP